ncbi:MAG: cytochrome c biogenesis protein CcsA [Vulcanimicrobiota bacterium]
MRFLVLLILLWQVCLPALAVPQPDLTALKLVPAQQGGRLKPLDTVARENVQQITGKASFHGEDPLWTSLRWMSNPKDAYAEENVECRNLALKAALGLKAEQRWFSMNELSENKKLLDMQAGLDKVSPDAELSDLDKEFEQLLMRMQLMASIIDGETWKIVPNPKGVEEPWQSLADLKSRLNEPPVAALATVVGELLRASHDKDFSKLQSEEPKLAPALSALGPTPAADKMALEVHYNQLHPFRMAWIFYALGLCPLLFAGRAGKLYWLGLASTLVGFAYHCYGFYLRCNISGRAPVTNMYESVIWVAFGAVLFALGFEFRSRARVYLLAALTFAVAALVMADNLPAVLNPNINPLMPVLRNNFWLTIHVLTITLSYAAFALALGLGHMVVWGYAFQNDQKERLNTLNKALYKAIQIGILLLAAGTILGGVWANYSWGRFWGWDPKEVWALVALLGYLALLHGRYAGWLGHFGLAAGSILAFMGVMMAWYGVNFILGAGLHSYGFGTGGGQYVAVWAGVEGVFVALTTARYRTLRKAR